jgi:undecaprenyl-diphosphatase
MNLVLEILKAIILGIVQGITEWLPISSTGHMILVNQFLKLNFPQEFVDTFLVVIQLGSILAVIVMYWEKLWPFSRQKTAQQKHNTWVLWFHILVACVPAGIAGVLLDDVIDQYLYNPFIIALALIIFGVGFLIVEGMQIAIRIRKTEKIDYLTAFEIGLFQMMALVPGVSRSGSTILGGRLLGCSKEAVTEFSFFMAVPVMLGASGLKLVKAGLAFTSAEWIVLLTGSLVAFLVSVAAIRFLLSYIRKHSFKAFGIYRIVLGVLVLLYFYVLP